MTTLFGINNCDTVRKARKWLASHDIAHTFVDFRADGIDNSQVNTWIQALGIEIFVNKRSTSWKALSDEQRGLFSEVNHTHHSDEICTLIVDQPTLIKRPLLEHQQQVHVGFKDTIYNDIFQCD